MEAHGVLNPPSQSCCIVLILRITRIIGLEPVHVDLCVDLMPLRAVTLETGHPGIPLSFLVTLDLHTESAQLIESGSTEPLMLNGCVLKLCWCAAVHCSIYKVQLLAVASEANGNHGSNTS